MRYLFYSAILVIIFTLGGIYSTLYPKSNVFRHSWQALRAAVTAYGSEIDASTTKPAQDKSGVTKYDPTKALDGYTAYTINNVPKLLLIDMEGNVKKEWNLDNVATSNHLNELEINKSSSFRRAYIHPNGDATIMLSRSDRTPYGGAIIRLDENGKLKWFYGDKRSHHDLDTGPDGKIYALTHEITYRSTPDKRLSSDPLPYLEDYITVLDENGQEIYSLSITELINKYPNTIVANFDVNRLLTDKLQLGNGEGNPFHDSTHANTIVYVTKDIAQHFDSLNEGNIIVNLRELNIIIGVDLESKKIVWYTSGPWLYPHEPQLLDNGNIMIFDNLGIQPYARVLEFDPKTRDIVWKFEGSEETPFESREVGTQQTLANGNVIIAESLKGRILEVNRDGEIVWEYYSPIDRYNKEGEVTTLIPFSTRYLKEDLPFLNESNSE